MNIEPLCSRCRPTRRCLNMHKGSMCVLGTFVLATSTAKMDIARAQRFYAHIEPLCSCCRPTRRCFNMHKGSMCVLGTFVLATSTAKMDIARAQRFYAHIEPLCSRCRQHGAVLTCTQVLCVYLGPLCSHDTTQCRRHNAHSTFVPHSCRY
jgi:hypothetical protein